MSGPISVDLPHNLGAAEAKRRISGNMDKLGGHLPPGARLRPAWDGDRLALGIGLLGQEIDAAIDIEEALVRVTVDLPPALGFFRDAIEAGLRRSGTVLLEDRT